MTTYEARDPNDIRKVGNATHEYKYLGTATVRPATAAELAQFAPLHAALTRRGLALKEAWWEKKLAQRKAVGQ